MMNESSERISAKRLSVVPNEMASAIWAATLDEDVDRLFELVDGVAEYDAEVAEYLRGLVEDVAYGKLKELFGG